MIACRTKGIQDYLSEEEIVYFEPGSVDDLALAIQRVYEDKERAREIMGRGHKVYGNFRWDFQKGYLVELFQALFSGKLHEVEPQLPEPGSKDITDVSITKKIS